MKADKRRDTNESMGSEGDGTIHITTKNILGKNQAYAHPKYWGLDGKPIDPDKARSLDFIAYKTDVETMVLGSRKRPVICNEDTLIIYLSLARKDRLAEAMQMADDYQSARAAQPRRIIGEGKNSADPDAPGWRNAPKEIPYGHIVKNGGAA